MSANERIEEALNMALGFILASGRKGREEIIAKIEAALKEAQL